MELKNVSVGIDGISVSISRVLVNRPTYLPSEKQWFMQLVPKRNQTEIAIVLPRTVRETNVDGFSVKDARKLFEDAESAIRGQFERNFPQAEFESCVVRSIEVALTVSFREPGDSTVVIDNLINLFSRSLLETDVNRQQNAYLMGKRREGYLYLKDQMVKSFETKTDTSGRFKVKTYSKQKGSAFDNGKEQDSVFRLELVYGERGIRQALKLLKGEPIYFAGIFNEKAIVLLVNEFRKDVTKKVLPSVTGMLNDITNVFYKSLRQKKGYDAIMENVGILYDYQLFSKALHRNYRKTGKTEDAFRRQRNRLFNRLKNQNKNTEIPDGDVITILQLIAKEVRD